MKNLAKTVEELQVYQRSFEFQQAIFVTSRLWPIEERFALIDQVRRSSRSIGANMSEAWAKRRYPAHFLSKLTDADGELQETKHWIRTARACGYVSEKENDEWISDARQIGAMLGSMIVQHDRFTLSK